MKGIYKQLIKTWLLQLNTTKITLYALKERHIHLHSHVHASIV